MQVHPNRQKWISRRLMWVGAAVVCALLISAAIQHRKQGEIPGDPYITIRDESELKFLNANRVKTIIFQQLGYELKGRPLGTVDLGEVEKCLEKSPFIKDADVYSDARNGISIIITQRSPIVRVMQNDGSSYYLDENGIFMPSSPAFAARVPVATGYTGKFDEHYREIKGHIVADIFKLAKYITTDEFWTAQIEQIYVDNSNNLYLVPKVGDQVISFGNTEDMEDKFKRLKVFYDEALPREGWDKYKTLSVRFKKQIIAVKR